MCVTIKINNDVPDLRFRSTERDLDRELCFEFRETLELSGPYRRRSSSDCDLPDIAPLKSASFAWLKSHQEMEHEIL